jgi:GNAT superfamily N-acetyltransferase
MSTDVVAHVRLRPLQRTDLVPAQAISASFGWPHRVEDWEFMLGLGRGWAAELDGVLVAAGLCWMYGQADAALGMICVDRNQQGKGIGRSLLRTLLHALEGRRVMLHSTDEGLPLYGLLGFVPAGQIRQHQGAAFQPPLMPLRTGERVRPTGRSDPAPLSALDREASGMDRRDLIAALLAAGTAVVLDEDGVATGFAILRRFGIGQVIGPVVARDAAGARALIGHFLAASPGQFMRIDVPEGSGLSNWLQSLGLADAGGAVRMVRGVGREYPRSFALVSQAFG